MTEKPSQRLQCLCAKNLARERLAWDSGLGYVGLPLAVEFSKAGFSVTGIDVSATKVDQVNRGESYIGDVPAPEVNSLMGRGQAQRNH
jgi:UDP-N-acetyl-D-glucosamine dehydrogenase